MKSIRCVASLLLTACFAFGVNAHFWHPPYTPNDASSALFAEKWIRTELYFGMSRKGGAEISEAEFRVSSTRSSRQDSRAG